MKIKIITPNEEKHLCVLPDDETIEMASKFLSKKFNIPFPIVLKTNDGFTLDAEAKVKDILENNDIIKMEISFPDGSEYPVPKLSNVIIKPKRLTSRLHLYSKEEQATRIQLAALYRLFDLFGWTDTIYGHLTSRAEPNSDYFLINPFGLHYSEITASSLVKIDLKGNIIDGGNVPEFGINRAGYVIHSAIHEARKDIYCVLHCHEPNSVALASRKEGLLPLTQTSHILGKVAYHDYEGIVVDEDEKKRIVRDLGDANILILRNHGIVACGQSIGGAFLNIFTLINACKYQIKSGSEKIILPNDEVMEKVYKVSHSFSPNGFGDRELCAMMRFLDEKDVSYKL